MVGGPRAPHETAGTIEKSAAKAQKSREGDLGRCSTRTGAAAHSRHPAKDVVACADRDAGARRRQLQLPARDTPWAPSVKSRGGGSCRRGDSKSPDRGRTSGGPGVVPQTSGFFSASFVPRRGRGPSRSPTSRRGSSTSSTATERGRRSASSAPRTRPGGRPAHNPGAEVSADRWQRASPKGARPGGQKGPSTCSGSGARRFRFFLVAAVVIPGPAPILSADQPVAEAN